MVSPFHPLPLSLSLPSSPLPPLQWFLWSGITASRFRHLLSVNYDWKLHNVTYLLRRHQGNEFRSHDYHMTTPSGVL